jgi:protease I
MSDQLTGKRIALLATDGFEQSELFVPKEALEKEGAIVEVLSLTNAAIKGWDKKDWGKSIAVNLLVSEANPADYAGLLLPGGVMNPDKLRDNKDAVGFVTGFLESGKPIAAICHAPSLLIETELLGGRKLTSYSSIKTDLINAGAEWSDQEVVVDHGLVTSRSPSDLPAFCKKMIEEFVEGKHYGSNPSAEGFSAIL